MNDAWLKVADVDLSMDLSDLVNLLRTQQLPYRVTEERGRQVIWVQDDALIPSLREVVDKLESGELKFERPAQVPTGPLKTRAMPAILVQLMRFPVTTWLLVLSIVGYLVVEMNWLQAFAYLIFLEPQHGELLSLKQTLLDAQLWRLWTPAFLHFDIFHIVFNALWFWDLGRRLECLQGRWRYLASVMFLAAAANISQYYWDGAAVFGGMSGVIYGLVGYIAVRKRLAPDALINIPNGIIIFMLVWLCLCMVGVVDLFMAGGVANGAHVGGLVAGIVLALVASKQAVVHQLRSLQRHR